MERRGSGIPLNLAEMKGRQRVSVTKIRTTANCNLLELITRHFFSPSRPWVARRVLLDSAWTWAIGHHLGGLPGDLPIGANTPRPLGFNLGSTDTSQCSQQLGVRGSC